MQPRATIRRIVGSDPEYGIFVLTAFAGMSLAFIDLVSRSSEREIPLLTALAAILLGGPVRAFVNLYIGGWLLSWIGRWLGGTAAPAEVRAAIAWSNLPVALGCLGILVVVGMGGEGLLERGFAIEASEGLSSRVLDAVIWIERFLFVWGYLFLALCLAAVQGFSIWKSIMSMVGVWALISFPALLVLGDHWLLPLASRLTGAIMALFMQGAG